MSNHPGPPGPGALALTHLLPAYGGLALLWAGGLASYGFLVAHDPRFDEAWRERIGRPG